MLTRSAIFESVWGYDFGSSSNSLGVYMGYLRRKTEDGDEPRLLHTVRGVGYVLRSVHELPRRITLVSAAAVAIAVVLASMLTYVLTSNQLHSHVDTSCANARGVRDAERRCARSTPRRTPRRRLRPAAAAGRNSCSTGSPCPAPRRGRAATSQVAANGRSTPACVRSAAHVSLPVDAAHGARRARRPAVLPRRDRDGDPPARARRALGPAAACSSPSRSPKSTACSTACA